MSKKYSKFKLILPPTASGLFILLLVGILPLVIISSQVRQTMQQHASANGNIVVDYSTVIQKLDPKAIGLDISGYYTPLAFANDTVEQQKIKQLGIKYARMHLIYQVSGDPTSKIICGGTGCNMSITGDQWINAIKSIGAEPVVVIYTKSSVDAANLVKHFNKDTNNPVKYWIVGNEPNINGYSVQSYSNYFNQDYDAMKAIDPTIKIGGGTTAWYDQTWLQQFLQLSGSKVDFVDFHGYPQQGTVAGDYTKLFQNADGYGKDLTSLQAVIKATVPARASQIAVQVGEWELNWGGGAQDYLNFHSVWAATVLGNILKAGGYSLFYADKGNLLYNSSLTFTDSTGRTFTVSQDDTNAAYHGIGMFTGEGLFPHFGDTMVNATTSLPNIEVFASDNPKNIVVINKDPSVSQVATIALNGLSSGTFDVWRKDESIIPINPPVKLGSVAISNGAITYPLPPFSVTTFVLTSGTTVAATPLPTLAQTTVTAAPNTVSTTPTVTPKISISPVPIISLPATQGKIIASDTFHRANQSLWGTASDGNIWKGDANTQKVFSIMNNTGVIGSGYDNHNAVIGTAVANAQIVFSGSMSSFANTNLGGVLRWTDTNNWYKAYIDGGNFFIQKKVAGTSTLLKSKPFPATINTNYTIRFQVVGSALMAKVWKTGQSEPVTWTLTATDNSLSSGYCGLRALIQTGKTAYYSSFAATSL